MRERQDRIFTWASSVLTLFIGVLLVIDSSKEIVWSRLGIWGKIIFTFAIILIVLFSVRWQTRNRKWQEENKKVINRIAILLHCFDVNYYQSEGLEDEALFESRWNKRNKAKKEKEVRKIGDRLDELLERYLPINFVSITYFLGILAIVLIWLPRN